MKYPSGIVIEIGDLESTGRAGVLIDSDVESLKGSSGVLYRECLVIPADCIAEAEAVAIAPARRTITLRFETLPQVSIGQKVKVVG